MNIQMKGGRGNRRTTPDDRAANMAALYREGKTLKEIGAIYGVTRERIRQILTRDFGYRFENGGAHARGIKRHADYLAKQNAKSLARWGCSWEQYRQIRDLFSPTRRFNQQRMNAVYRGIEWNLTLWQWWTIWQESGHWNDRGRGQGYAMCRYGDTGPYAVGNVYIATNVQNIKDYFDRRRASQPKTEAA